MSEAFERLSSTGGRRPAEAAGTLRNEPPAKSGGAWGDRIASREALARSDSANRAQIIRQLQRNAGNHAVSTLVSVGRTLPPASAGRRGVAAATRLRALQRVTRRTGYPAVVARQPITKKAPPDQQRLSQLRSIALEAVDIYEDAAGDGIEDAVRTVADTAWGPWGAALAGNLIWALACFSTGGSAFVISLAGIGVGAVGTLPKSGPGFEKWAQDELVQRVVDYLETQVDRVTADVHATLESEGWDDNRIRKEILGRLLKPEYIETIQGGIPKPNRTAIRHRIHVELLIRANRQVAEPHPMQNPGYVHYYYTVTGHQPGGLGDKLEPLERWRYEFKRARLVAKEGDAAAVQEIRKDPRIRPRDMPWIKIIHIESPEQAPVIRLVLDGENRFFESHRNTAFPGPVDESELLRRLWRQTAGRPPDLDTSSIKD